MSSWAHFESDQLHNLFELIVRRACTVSTCAKFQNIGITICMQVNRAVAILNLIRVIIEVSRQVCMVKSSAKFKNIRLNC